MSIYTVYDNEHQVFTEYLDEHDAQVMAEAMNDSYAAPESGRLYHVESIEVD